MFRTLLAWISVGLLTAASGCRVCQSPYDYCGPVYSNGECGSGCLNAPRAGSVLAGGAPAALVEGGYLEGAVVEGQVAHGQIDDGYLLDGQPLEGQMIPAVEQPAAPSGQGVAPIAKPVALPASPTAPSSRQ